MGQTYRIIYVEDEQIWVDLLQRHLERVNRLEFNRKFNVKCELIHATSGEDFLTKLQDDGPFNLAFIDLELKGSALQGGHLLDRLQSSEDTLPRIVLTARPEWLSEEEALKLGVSEYYRKDVLIAREGDKKDEESHRQSIQSFLETFFDLPSRYDFVTEKGRKRFGLKREQAAELERMIVGDDLSMWRVKARVASAARSSLPVLLTGETGTGKELIAEMIHRLSNRGRKNYEWVAVNCAAFTAEMLMSELFGHVKGAFTDARAHKPGLLEEANESTLFLDEVGHAGPQLQAALLRALSIGKARRVGSTEEYTFDVRLIAATDQPFFDSETLQQSFINRLAGIHIEMPPLRSRKRDIDRGGLLVGQFAGQIAGREGKSVDFTPAAIMALRQYDWPGNVRELKHIVEEATQEAIRIGGESPKVTVDAAQVNWLLQQSMARFVHRTHDEQDVFAIYASKDQSYKGVEQRFLADYVRYMHNKISRGERNNAAYEATAKVLGCSINTVKSRLADYDRLKIR